MGTLSPQDLLKKWQTDPAMTPEMAVGHILQNLVQLADQPLQSRVAVLSQRVTALERQVADLQTRIDP